MCGLAMIGNLQPSSADSPRVRNVVHARIDQHHRVDSFEEPLAKHDILSAAAFLAGRAQRDDSPADLVDDRCHSDSGADTSRGNDVVAAALPVNRESVVFAKEGDTRAGLARAYG